MIDDDNYNMVQVKKKKKVKTRHPYYALPQFAALNFEHNKMVVVQHQKVCYVAIDYHKS